MNQPQRPRPLRVTMIGSLPPQRGVSQYTFDLAQELARQDGVRLDVLSFRSLYPRRLYPGGDPEDHHAKAADVPGARTRRALRWWNPFGWLLAACTLRGDVVHAQWWSFPLAPIYIVLLSVARLRGKRVVLTVHNAEPHERGLLRRIANRAVLPFADRIIVHTQRNAATLAESGVRPHRIAVVPIGVRPARQPTAEERAAARRNLRVDDAPLVLFQGNIRQYKGVSDLLAAFRYVAEAIPEARLIIAGQPWGDPNDIQAQVASLGLSERVMLRLEYLPAAVLDELFVASDVVVYPYTHFDAQSAAACDALRYGRACIVTDVGGLPDLVRNPRAVVPSSAPAALAEALLAVLRHPSLRAALEADAREVAAGLAWTAVARLTVEHYHDLLSGTPAPSPPVSSTTPVEEAVGPRERGWT